MRTPPLPMTITKKPELIWPEQTVKRFSVSILVFSVLLVSLGSAQAQGTLYLVTDNGDDQLYTVNVADATVTKIGLAGAIQSSAEGLAPSATAALTLYSVNNSSDLDIVNTDGTGYTTVGGGDTLSDCDRGLAFNTATGILYGVDNSSFCEINQTTGAITSLASPPGGDTEGLAADPINNYVYGINDAEDLVRYAVETGTWITVGPTNIFSGNDIGLAYDPDNQILYAADSDGLLYGVNPTNGLTTLIGDTGLPSGDYGLAFVSSSVQGTAYINVVKTFSNGASDEVEVTLSCNAGLPLEQSFTITGGDPTGVTFTVTNIPDGGAKCSVTENGDDSAYTTVMTGGDAGDDCVWASLTGGIVSCEISNVALPTTVEIDTSFEDIADDGTASDVDTSFETVITCQGVSVDNDNSFEGVQVSDTSGSFTADWYIDPVNGASCTVVLNTESDAVEGDSCEFSIALGDELAGCEVVGTVFFEGVPVMNRYGMVLMALLMLGVGFIAVRRFA